MRLARDRRRNHGQRARDCMGMGVAPQRGGVPRGQIRHEDMVAPGEGPAFVRAGEDIPSRGEAGDAEYIAERFGYAIEDVIKAEPIIREKVEKAMRHHEVFFGHEPIYPPGSPKSKKMK